jgi:DMSO/TMAO reductase YedYZ molybdopterin-dependent catalytic subunit
MGTTTVTTGSRRRTTAAGAGLALVAGMLLAACGGGSTGAPAASPVPAPPPTTTVDAAAKPYCDTVARVQAEQSSPQYGQGGVPAASAAVRRQVADLVATAPPELADDWRVVQRLTEQALGSLAGTRGDPKKIDRDELTALQAQSRPATAHIKSVTEQRCHVVFRTPS